MVSFFTRTAFTAAASFICVFAFGASAAAPDVGLQNVALSCSDGTSLGLSLAPTEVTSLTEAVSAMALYPAGLACGLSPQSDPPPGGNPNWDYAVGGGDQIAATSQGAPCQVNFGFSAHAPSESTQAKGTFNETVPGGCAGLGDTGSLRVDIDCLDVEEGHAYMHGRVRQATGLFASDGFAPGGDAYISTTDSTTDMGRLDMLRVETTSSGTSPDCGGVIDELPISNGNISVHDADLATT